MKSKLINDPVHGFLNFSEPSLTQLIDHPWFQRLRYISQMGVAKLVYPGADHTRFLHSLGATHLMGQALDVLHNKGISILKDEYVAARQAILLHDIGHGPFSHALEHSIIQDIDHEYISKVISQKLNKLLGGSLELSLSIFEASYPKKFLHELVSSQLDVDRLDYLSRDSFYSGVSEGIIGYDRILKMLTIVNDELAVEEKGIFSIEKFIIARHIMYWQVYLHKTVLGAEQLLVKILYRAKELCNAGVNLWSSQPLAYFLYNNVDKLALQDDNVIELYCSIDDSDILTAVKQWTHSSDKVLSILSQMFVGRKLYKVLFDSKDESTIYEEQYKKIKMKLALNDQEMAYFLFRGQTSNSAYNNTSEHRILILQKDGNVVNLADMSHSLFNNQIAQPVVKSYICYYRC